MPCLVLQVGLLYAYIYSSKRLNNTSTIFCQSLSPILLHKWCSKEQHRIGDLGHLSGDALNLGHPTEDALNFWHPVRNKEDCRMCGNLEAEVCTVICRGLAQVFHNRQVTNNQQPLGKVEQSSYVFKNLETFVRWGVTFFIGKLEGEMKLQNYPHAVSNTTPSHSNALEGKLVLSSRNMMWVPLSFHPLIGVRYELPP
jgi:hypothetical protein